MNDNTVQITKSINLSRDKLSDNGRLIPAEQVITMADLDDNGNQRCVMIDGKPVASSKDVAVLAFDIPTKADLAGAKVNRYDNIKTSGKFGTGSSFGQFQSFDHKSFTYNGQRRNKGAQVSLNGATYTLEICLTKASNQDTPADDHNDFKEPLHRAGFRLVIDQQTEARQFYHLRSNKPATIDEVHAAIGDEAHKLLNSNARTGA